MHDRNASPIIWETNAPGYDMPLITPSSVIFRQVTHGPVLSCVVGLAHVSVFLSFWFPTICMTSFVAITSSQKFYLRIAFEVWVPGKSSISHPLCTAFLEKPVEKTNTLLEPSPKHNGGSCDTEYVVKGSCNIQIYNTHMSWEVPVGYSWK